MINVILVIESLFTNVPVDETIEIIKKAFFRKKTEIIKRVDKNVGNKNIRKGISEYEGSLDGLPWEHFEYLLRNCLQESTFMFNKKYYKQKDGVSMGIKLAPIFSDVFMKVEQMFYRDHRKDILYSLQE